MEEPSRPELPIPIVTYSMLAINAIVFIAMLIAGHGDVSLDPVPLNFGAKVNALIQQGEVWRLITPMFLHGSWPHLLVNGFSLYQLGGSLERIYGSRKYLLIYVVAGIAGNYLSYRMTPTPSLGASGAIFGLVGAGLVFPLRYSAYIPQETRSAILRQLAPIAAINLAIGFMLKGMIDNWAHIGGLLGGGFVALFLIPAVLETDARSRLKEAALWVLSMAAVGLIVWAGLMQWRLPKKPIPPPLPPMASYSPQEPNPWWSIRVPQSWSLQNGVWVSPKGAVLKIDEIKSNDTITDPVIAVLIASLLQQPPPTDTEMDGKPGWHRLAKSREKDGQHLLDIYVIKAYDRLFVLELDCPEAANAATQYDYALILNSVRFLHAPAPPKQPNPPGNSSP